MSKWIDFVLLERPLDRKTDVWRVAPKVGGMDIGEVKFSGAWRKFAFFPFGGTIFDEGCLRDIASFCEERTRLWRLSKQT